MGVFDVMSWCVSFAILGLGAENTGQFVIVQWTKIQSKHMMRMIKIHRCLFGLSHRFLICSVSLLTPR